MPLNAKALGEALHEDLTLHSTLCRRDAGAFQKAIQSGQDVVVACTQEQRLFGDLGQQTEGAVSPIRFVNIRETGGWSRDAAKASPKIAALLAAARLPDPPPVPTVTYKSTGRLLIIGPLDQAEQAAALVSDVLDVTLFTQGPGNAGGAQARRYPVLVTFVNKNNPRSYAAHTRKVGLEVIAEFEYNNNHYYEMACLTQR